MRKSTWKTLAALALASAGIATNLLAGEPDGHVVVPGGPAPGKQEKSYAIREYGPIHLRADAADQDPGVRNAGPVRYSSPLEAWIVDRNAVTYPPDYGWSRPIKRPILNRIPVQYHRMDPDYWYGDPRAFQGIQEFPMVYQPTDTTQLGYYYQRVPTWQANPNMIPGPPWPSTWHNRECPDYQRLHHPDIRFESGRGMYGSRSGRHGCSRCGSSSGCACGEQYSYGPSPSAPGEVREHAPARPADPAPAAPAPAKEPAPETRVPEAVKSTRILFPGSGTQTATGSTNRARN